MQEIVNHGKPATCLIIRSRHILRKKKTWKNSYITDSAGQI